MDLRQTDRMETTYAISEDQAKQRRMEAIFAHEEAKDERARLILEGKRIAKQHRTLAAMWRELRMIQSFHSNLKLPYSCSPCGIMKVLASRTNGSSPTR